MTLHMPFSERLVLSGADRRLAAPPRRGRLAQRYGPRVELWFDEDPDARAPALPDPDAPELDDLTETERIGLEAFRYRQSTEYQRAKAVRPREGEPWDMPNCVDRSPSDPTAKVAGTSDYLEGSVALGLIFVNGPTADLRFSPAQRTKAAGEAQTGVAFLAGVNPAAGVSFHYEIHVVDIDVPADPTLPESELEALWREPVLDQMGFANTSDYVKKLRADFGTKWAYAAFFTKYPVDHFAYANSVRVVMEWNDDAPWPDDMDRVFAHETGHVFGAPDEYAAADCDCGGAHGRFGHANDNCETCAPGGGVQCLMRYNSWQLCNATYRHLGWMMPVRSPDRSWITAVSSTPHRLDVFTVDKSKLVRTAFWEPGMEEWYQGWLHVLDARAPAGSPVAAVSRREGQLDLFVVADGGHVWTAARGPGQDWVGWWPIGDVRVPDKAHVGAVSRSSDQLDIFVTDEDGRTMTAAWAPWHADGWTDWRQVAAGQTSPGAPITAVSRSTNLLDIFVTGPDGGVYTASWSPAHSDGWFGWSRIGDVVAAKWSYVGAVSRRTDHLDIFVTDEHGRTMTAAWAPWHTDGWTDWRHVSDGLAVPGAPVTAVSRSEDQIDIFVTGINGGIATASWAPWQADGWTAWSHLNGGMTLVATPVTAVSRSTDHLDVFVLGPDDRPATASWSPHAAGGWWGFTPMGA